MDVMDRGIGNEDVVSADVEEGILNPITNQLSHQSQVKSDTYLRQFLFSPVVVVVYQVRLLEEWTETSLLKHLKPRKDFGEFLVPHVQLNLELAEGKGFARVDVRLNESREHIELPRLDVNFEDINVLVT